MKRLGRFAWWMAAALLAVLWIAGCGENNVGDDRNEAVETSHAEPPADSTILLVAGVGPLPKTMKLSRGREESVWWQNEGDRGVRISFPEDRWPFREPYQEILVDVANNRKSKKFHVYKNQTMDKYYYSVRSTPMATSNQQNSLSPGPDPPAVEVGP